MTKSFVYSFRDVCLWVRAEVNEGFGRGNAQIYGARAISRPGFPDVTPSGGYAIQHRLFGEAPVCGS